MIPTDEWVHALGVDGTRATWRAGDAFILQGTAAIMWRCGPQRCAAAPEYGCPCGRWRDGHDAGDEHAPPPRPRHRVIVAGPGVSG